MKNILPLLLALLLTGGCVSEASHDSGSLSLGLRDSVSGWFHVRILDGAPHGNARVVFETGCIDAKSRTYELNNIPAGENRWVVIESFGSAQCTPDSRAEVGYRGEVSITGGNDAPYFHVPIFEQGASTAFPVDLNISASVAEAVDFCDSDEQCAQFSDQHVCFDGQSPTYWCVPSCDADADCTDYHPGATCEGDVGWCTLSSPFPLNLGAPRAFGHATATGDGSVAFIGGFGSRADGRLVANQSLVEVFDVELGLFTKPEIAGLNGWRAGLSGLATLSDGRIVVVGGARSAELRAEGTGPGVHLTLGDLTEDDCTGDACVPNIRNEMVVIDLADGTAAVHDLPLPVAMPTVLSLGKGRLLIAGGVAPKFSGIGEPPVAGGNVATARAFLVTLGDDVEIRDLGKMTTPRMGASARCQSASCSSILVIGGNTSGASAEVISFSGDDVIFVPVALNDLPATVHGAEICNGDLVGGSDTFLGAGPLKLGSLDVVDGNWSHTAFEGGDVMPASVMAAVTLTKKGDCWVAGGIRANGTVSAAAHLITDDAVHPKTLAMSRARFAGMAAQIGTGLLADGIIFAGGLRLNADIEGGLEWVRGAEILLP